MSRRPGRELEQEDHYVYVLRDHDYEVVYVGRTSRPDTRPHDTTRRPWMKTEVDRAETDISPAMSFQAASWAESHLIRALSPKYNKQIGQTEFPADKDWRIDRLCEVEGVSRTTAKQFVRYYPKDPAAFEAALAEHVEKRAALEAEAAELGVDPDALALSRVGDVLDAALSGDATKRTA